MDGGMTRKAYLFFNRLTDYRWLYESRFFKVQVPGAPNIWKTVNLYRLYGIWLAGALCQRGLCILSWWCHRMYFSWQNCELHCIFMRLFFLSNSLNHVEMMFLLNDWVLWQKFTYWWRLRLRGKWPPWEKRIKFDGEGVIWQGYEKTALDNCLLQKRKLTFGNSCVRTTISQGFPTISLERLLCYIRCLTIWIWSNFEILTSELKAGDPNKILLYLGG